MTKFQIKRGAATKWANRQLNYGELGLDLTNQQVRIGKKDGGTFSEALLLNQTEQDMGDLDV